ncbi:nitroreductase family deazaflavin-dependent oxidoreductase [Mycobacterium tilburgii]|uniref:nitroreductase family deazaflavin-dependent oxidoreductase n=1 Tax=Mycobacterium tilburgii TaxID=44467 RepID=UPI0011835E07|nr:nitroreductase family deazaflavin-dependent oxidoreductase [Mycobacterium tilburgii]
MVTPFPALLLAHIGAKSGIPRTSTVVYFTDWGRVIVIASNFGSPRNPVWYHNVKAHPEVTIEAGRFGGRFVAEDVTGIESDRLFALARGATSPYGRYQDTAGSRLNSGGSVHARFLIRPG